MKNTNSSSIATSGIPTNEVKLLAQHLDRYIEHELADNTDDSWREFFERALMTYEDMRGVRIGIKHV